MKLLRQAGLILFICFLGEALHRILRISIPGNVLGMVVLLLCLLTGVIKVSMVEDICKFLLDHLAFLFLPAGVGLIACRGYSTITWLVVVLISLISTIIVMVTTGIVVQLLKRS